MFVFSLGIIWSWDLLDSTVCEMAKLDLLQTVSGEADPYCIPLCMSVHTFSGSAIITWSWDCFCFWNTGAISHIVRMSEQTRCQRTGKTCRKETHQLSIRATELPAKVHAHYHDDVSLTWSADCKENILESTFMVRGSLSLCGRHMQRVKVLNIPPRR